jgi:hypothetical protein
MAFIYLVKKPQVFGQIAQWLLSFLEYDFLVVYKPRKSHSIAYALFLLLAFDQVECQIKLSMPHYSYSNHCGCKKFMILANIRFSNFVHIRTKMEIDFKGLTLHIATRQFVQIGLGPDFFMVLTP